MKLTTKVLLAAVITHIAVFSGLSILIYRNIGAGLINGGDFANVNQVLWSTVRGRFMQGTTVSYMFQTTGPYSHFATHFEPIYLLILPFYALRPAVETLIFVKSVFLALATIPLYFLVWDLLGPAVALIISFGYLLAPTVAMQGFYPLHAEEYATFFIACLFYFFHNKRFKIFIVFALLTLFIKELMPIFIFMFGVYAIINKRELKWSIPLLVISLLYFIIVVYYLMPLFGSGIPSSSSYLYSRKIFSLDRIFGIIRQTFLPEGIGTLVSFLIPFGLVVPLLSQVVIFMVPDIFVKLGVVGVGYGVQHSSAIFTMLVFVSLAYVFNNLSGFLTKHIGRKRAQRFIICLSVILCFSMVYRSKGAFNPRYYKRNPYYTAQQQAIKFIPPDASVSAPNYLLPYLSNRFELDEIGHGKYNDSYRGYDYIVLDTHWENSGDSELRRTKELVELLPRRPDYKLVFSQGGILIYRKY